MTESESVQRMTKAAASTGLRDYFTPDALIRSVHTGSIAPLRGSWIIHLQNAGGALSRRQELPKEAFFTAADISHLVTALGDNWGLLVVALSYKWLSAVHPDPTGFHLTAVARIARLYLKHDQSFGPDAYFSPLVEAFVAAGVPSRLWDFALMWDFGSLYQRDRSPDPEPFPAHEEKLFYDGLGMLNIWYGHARTACWMQTSLPDEPTQGALVDSAAQPPPDHVTYAKSGWADGPLDSTHSDPRQQLGVVGRRPRRELPQQGRTRSRGRRRGVLPPPGITP